MEQESGGQNNREVIARGICWHITKASGRYFVCDNEGIVACGSSLVHALEFVLVFYREYTNHYLDDRPNYLRTTQGQLEIAYE